MKMTDNKLQLNGIPSVDVMRVWEDIQYLLKSALEYADHKYTIFDVQYALMSRDMQLWLVMTDDDVIQSMIITQIVQYPNKKVMFFVFAAGVKSNEWIHFIDHFKDFAAEHQCHAIEVLGRAGWEKKFKSLGFTKVHTVYSLPL